VREAGAEVIKMSGDLTGTSGEGAADGPAKRPAADMVELRLTGEQIALLRREGEVRPVAAGEILFREGDRGYDFIVILTGRVAIVDHQAGTDGSWRPGGRETLSPS
jgi:thioredoxin reductase (NADPH)